LRARAVRARRGCLTGCVLPLLGTFVAIGAVILLSRALFSPWAFFLGGRFHFLPSWSGRGTVHARSGDYVLSLTLEPPSPRRTRSPRTRIAGDGFLVTPRGERFRMRVYGAFDESNIGIQPDGRHLALSLSTRLPPWDPGQPDRRPRLEVEGGWRGPNLVLRDRGSFSRAFLDDGRVWRGPGWTQPPPRDTLTFVLRSIGFRESLLPPALPGR